MQTRGLKSSNCATKNLPTSGSFSSEINQLISCYLSIALSHPLSMPKIHAKKGNTNQGNKT